MSQFNLRKKEDVFLEKIVYLEQQLERKEAEISKLKLRLFKSRPEHGITNVGHQHISPAFCNSLNPNLENKKFDDFNETTEKNTVYSFCTSTPKSEFDRCDECLDKSECVDCIVKHVLRKHESLRKILF